MKNVKDLINYLKTKDEQMSLAILYDGMFADLNIFEEKGILCFSDRTIDSTYEEAKIEFSTAEQ